MPEIENDIREFSKRENEFIDHPSPVETDHPAPEQIDHLSPEQTDHLDRVFLM